MGSDVCGEASLLLDVGENTGCGGIDAVWRCCLRAMRGVVCIALMLSHAMCHVTHIPHHTSQITHDV